MDLAVYWCVLRIALFIVIITKTLFEYQYRDEEVYWRIRNVSAASSLV